MALINTARIVALDVNSTPETINNILEDMALAVESLGTGVVSNPDVPVMPVHMSTSQSLCVWSFSPRAPQMATGATVDFDLYTGSALFETRLPRGCPPVTILGGCAVAEPGSTVGVNVLFQLRINGAVITPYIPLAAAGVVYNLGPFTAKLADRDVLEGRLQLNNSVSGEVLNLQLTLVCSIPLLHAPYLAA